MYAQSHQEIIQALSTIGSLILILVGFILLLVIFDGLFTPLKCPKCGKKCIIKRNKQGELDVSCVDHGKIPVN